VSGDLTARVAELAALAMARLAEEEALALAAAAEHDDLTAPARPDWYVQQWADPDVTAVVADPESSAWPVARVCDRPDGAPAARAAHIARNDPARVLRRVRATRDLVAEILAEGHQHADDYFACSQAQEGDGLISGPTGPPGSGCSDPERAGKPCDCGRDARVARLLGIIASEWEADEP
jgi:Family of unknown function (DUF6221)